MLDLSPEKLFVLGMVALVVLGPNRLPEVARMLGHWLSKLRAMSSSFQEEMRGALDEPRKAIDSALGEWKVPPSPRAAVRGAVASMLTGPPARPTPTRPTASSVGGGGVASSPDVAAPPPARPSASGMPVPDDPSLN